MGMQNLLAKPKTWCARIRKNRANVIIDPGTTSTKFAIDDSEVHIIPTVLLVDKTKEPGRDVVDYGDGALASVGKVSENMRIIRPLRDARTTEPFYVSEFMKRACAHVARKEGKIIDETSTVLTTVHTKADPATFKLIYDCTGKAIRHGTLLVTNQTMLTGIGADLDIEGPEGYFIAGSGGGTFDVSAIVRAGQVENASDYLLCAGTHFNKLIIKYFRDKYQMLIGEQEAERIKKEVGCALGYDPYLEHLDYFYTTKPKSESEEPTDKQEPDNRVKYVEDIPKELPGLYSLIGQAWYTVARGKTLSTFEAVNMYKRVTRSEISEVLREGTREQTRFIRTVIGQVPPDMSGSLQDSGIVLGGGSALLRGFTTCIFNDTNIKADLVKNPIECVAEGGKKALSNRSLLEKIAWELTN